MKARTILTAVAVAFTVALLASEAIIYEAGRKPVNVALPATPKASVSSDFWILLPGNYHLEVVLDGDTPNARKALESALIEFSCWDMARNAPCDAPQPFETTWEVISGSQAIASSKRGERVRGGFHGNTWRRQLGIMQLPVGHLTLRAVTELPQTAPVNLNPRLVLSGGTGAAKTVQSPIVGYVWMFWMLGRVLLWFVAGALWIIVYLLWLHSVSTTKPGSGVSV